MTLYHKNIWHKLTCCISSIKKYSNPGKQNFYSTQNNPKNFRGIVSHKEFSKTK